MQLLMIKPNWMNHKHRLCQRKLQNTPPFHSCRIEKIESLEPFKCTERKQIVLVEDGGEKINFILWGEQVSLANLFRFISVFHPIQVPALLVELQQAKIFSALSVQGACLHWTVLLLQILRSLRNYALSTVVQHRFTWCRLLNMRNRLVRISQCYFFLQYY